MRVGDADALVDALSDAPKSPSPQPSPGVGSERDTSYGDASPLPSSLSSPSADHMRSPIEDFLASSGRIVGTRRRLDADMDAAANSSPALAPHALAERAASEEQSPSEVTPDAFCNHRGSREHEEDAHSPRTGDSAAMDTHTSIQSLVAMIPGHMSSYVRCACHSTCAVPANSSSECLLHITHNRFGML